MRKLLKLSLDLGADEEIREYIKSLIADQVKAVSREEIKDMVSACINERFPQITEERIETEIRNQIHKASTETIVVNGTRVGYLKQTIRDEVRLMVRDSLKDIDAAIQNAVVASLRRSSNVTG